MSRIGRAFVPDTLTIEGAQLLSDATFGVFDHWRESNRKQLSEAAAKIVERSLKSHIKVRRVQKDLLEIDLPCNETKDKALKRLEQADPANPAKNLEKTTNKNPTLFDDL